MITYTVKVNDVSTRWYLNGKRHREDGPAVEYTNGDKYWFLNDELHREDGPAVEYSHGGKVWYLYDINLTETEFNIRMNSVKELTVAEISERLGYEVKIVK